MLPNGESHRLAKLNVQPLCTTLCIVTVQVLEAECELSSLSLTVHH